ncbi:MAG: EF-hand domain-containing protein, partial [Candidatus Riflebacteria bacterium]|nr:EF-hand domain-containing protein [Candidatus Riflebacteria bacterium]
MKKIAIALAVFLLLCGMNSLDAAPGKGKGKAKGKAAKQDVSGKQQLKQALNRFDTDGDGKLSDEEKEAIRVFRANNQNRRAEFVKMFDNDGDGQLSEKE